MPSKEQVLRLLSRGRAHQDARQDAHQDAYQEIATALGIPPGQAYLIATGIPADGGGTVTRAQRERPGLLPSRSQRLVNPREVNPTAREDVHTWVRDRARADLPMRSAGKARS